MKLLGIFKQKRNIDTIILKLFFLFCFINQVKFLNDKFEILHDFIFVIFSILIAWSIFFNEKNIIKIRFFLPLILVSLIILIDFYYNRSIFDLRISIYFFLVVALSYLTNEIKLEFFAKSLIYFSLIFSLLGIYGWINGGQPGAWGEQYIYFSYKYLPSTRNEDIQIFIYGFLLSLLYLFLIRWDNKIFLINQINLIIIFLSYSRGSYLITFLNLSLFLIFYFFLKKKLCKKLMIYVLLTPIISFTSIVAINKTVDINLFDVFKVKLKSFNYKNEKLDLPGLESHGHLLKSSKQSLDEKINEWSSTKENIISLSKNSNFYVLQKVFINDKRYYESSFLYLLNNFNIIVILIILFFIIKNIYFSFYKYNNSNEKIFFVFLSTNFIFLNFIYNYMDDIWNYLIIYYLISVSNRKFKNNHK